MKIHVSVLFLLITLSLGAQNIAQLDYGGHLTFKPNTTAFLFGDNVKLRKAPDTTSEELALLRIGTEVTLLEITEVSKAINGFNSKWIKIKTDIYEGYLLDTFLSTATFIDLNYVTLINFKRDTTETLHLRLRFYDTQTTQYEEKTYKLPHESIHVAHLGAKGLDALSNILHVNYTPEACGMDSGGRYFFIKNNTIVEALSLYAVSEAGQFWQSEALVFPADDATIGRDHFKFAQEIGTVIDEDSQWYKKTIVERQYQIIEGKITPEFRSAYKN